VSRRREGEYSSHDDRESEFLRRGEKEKEKRKRNGKRSKEEREARFGTGPIELDGCPADDCVSVLARERNVKSVAGK